MDLSILLTDIENCSTIIRRHKGNWWLPFLTNAIVLAIFVVEGLPMTISAKLYRILRISSKERIFECLVAAIT